MISSFPPNNCRICNNGAWVTVLATRICDGDLLDNADYCRNHALDLLDRSEMGVALNLKRIGITLDECYRQGCDRTSMPAEAPLCEACRTARLADLWITCGTWWSSEWDVDQGIHLCAECAVRGFRETGLPERLRKEFMNAIFPEDL